MNKYLDNNGVLYFWNKIKTYVSDLLANKVDKIVGKGLSTNDLTDELLEKINNAGNSSFTGDYNDLTNKPNLDVYIEKNELTTITTAEIDELIK